MLFTFIKELLLTGITHPPEYFFLYLCLFLSVFFHVVRGIQLEPTLILFKTPYSAISNRDLRNSLPEIDSWSSICILQVIMLAYKIYKLSLLLLQIPSINCFLRINNIMHASCKYEAKQSTINSKYFWSRPSLYISRP